jgi:hypothetical protein
MAAAKTWSLSSSERSTLMIRVSSASSRVARKASFRISPTRKKLGLSLLELTELLVRRPVALLAGRAAVESRRTVAEVFGDFLSGTAAAVSGSWFGADCASHGWCGGGNHGCSGVDLDEVALCDGCSAKFALGGWMESGSISRCEITEG